MLENSECLFYNDLHSIGSDGTSDHGNCKKWWNNNDNCEGFTVYHGKCYFKSYECGNDIHNGRAVLYTKRGK